MKITSSRLDDLRRERDEWDANRDAAQERYNEQRRAYHRAEEDVYAPVREKIESDLSKFNLLDFEVFVKSGRYGEEGLEIQIKSDDRRHFDEAVALSWDYEVRLHNGEVFSETGSWSGLSATTPEQLASLHQTVEALEYLNAQDWDSILRKELPNYSDYITEMVPRNRPNFEFQIKEEELKELIGSGLAVKGKGIESLGHNPRNTCWYIINRETPKKYVVSVFSDWEKQRKNDEMSDEEIVAMYKDRWLQQIKKEYLLDALIYPFETIG